MSADVFKLTGAPFVVGRPFLPEEDTPERSAVAGMSNRRAGRTFNERESDAANALNV